MHDADFPQFVAVLDATCGLIARGAYKPDAQNAALWFRALGAYDLEAVRRGFDAHVRDPERGRFVPAPADIIGKIQAADGRPSSDEAWAIAMKAADEAATVTWTDEIAQAWGVCLPVWEAGDKVGARMAFKNAYERLAGEAKAAGRRVRWWGSLGHNPEDRAPALAQAAALGQIPFTDVPRLPAPREDTLTPLLKAPGMPNEVRQRLKALRDKLASNFTDDGYVPDPEIARTAELKQRAQDLTDAYERDHEVQP